MLTWSRLMNKYITWNVNFGGFLLLLFVPFTQKSGPNLFCEPEYLV